jgi:predicted aldo/keto reductase-like oxidoreductase
MADMGLTDEELRDLDPPSEDTTSGLYCQQCNSCLAQCPENLDIPTMMRSYMYAYGYRNLGLARNTMDRGDQHGLFCKDCNECLVNCTMGFDVREKILDISRIKEIPEDMIYLT